MRRLPSCCIPFNQLSKICTCWYFDEHVASCLFTLPLQILICANCISFGSLTLRERITRVRKFQDWRAIFLPLYFYCQPNGSLHFSDTFFSDKHKKITRSLSLSLSSPCRTYRPVAFAFCCLISRLSSLCFVFYYSLNFFFVVTTFGTFPERVTKPSARGLFNSCCGKGAPPLVLYLLPSCEWEKKITDNRNNNHHNK